MRARHLCLSILLLLSGSVAESQVPAKDAPQVLEELFDRLVNNYNDTARIRINDSIRVILDGYAKSDTVFTHRFDNLRYLGQIMSPDSSLKIITWNLVLNEKPGRYFCYLIRKETKGSPNKVYRLSAEYNEQKIRTDTTYTPADWYGALYYDLRPCDSDNGPCWILLGLDYGNASISRKIIEVLTFGPGESISFGRRWFDTGDGIRYRAVFEYASNAMMSLKFRSASSIVFDHLVPFSPAMKDDRQYYGPDYSFDAYDFKGGVWKLLINVDERNR
jgi:hypothetical protein